MTFSERYGYIPARTAVQLESMDVALRNGLWSLLSVSVWAKFPSGGYGGGYLSLPGNEPFLLLCQRLWVHHFKLPIDELNDDWDETLPELRSLFFKSSWHAVYDFVEFVANNFEVNGFKAKFTRNCNIALEREMSAYRFVDGTITRVTNSEELAEIEAAIETGAKPVATHLRRSLELMSDRKSPDFRNSIKESISAVESLVSSSVGAKGTLGQLLKKLETDIGLHPALKNSFTHLYGYTSDQSGVRHALMEGGAAVDFADAKFMLVVCSAFTNFVKAKLEAD